MHYDMKEIQVEGHPDLVRNTNNKSIVNKNKSEYETYMKLSRKRESEKNRISNMESDLSSLKGEITEIKNLLRELISK